MTTDDGLFGSVFAIFSGRMVVTLLGIVFTPILVRLLGQSDYGVFASVMALFGIVELVSKGGLFDSVRKHVAEHRIGSREQTQIVTASLVLAIGYGAVATVVTVAVVAFLSPSDGGYTNYLLLLAAAIVASNVFTVFRSVFYGRQQERVAERLSILRELTYTTVALVLAFVGFGVFGVVLGYTIAIYVSAIAACVVVYRTLDIDLSRSATTVKRHGRTVAVYGGLQATGGIAALLLYKTDILLVQYFRTSAETALYKAALTPAELIWFVPSVIQAALLQNVSDHWSNGRIEAINENVKIGLKYAFLTVTLLAVGLFGLAPEFLSIYFGTEYEASALSLRILLVGTFFFGLSRILVPVLQATGWIRYIESVTVVALVVNVGLNLLFIPRYGIEGAAVATAISYCVIFVGSLVIWRATDFELPNAGLVVRLSTSLGLFALIYVPITMRYDIGLVPSLLVYPVFGGLSFVVLAYLLGLLRIAAVLDLFAASLTNALTKYR